MIFTANLLFALSLASPTDVVIWFEHDSAALSPRAENTLQFVASQAGLEARLDGAPPVLILEGHADRVGSQHYNLELSARRSRAVRDRLIALGYEAGALSISALGESSPRVPTADEVAEGDNRRVEVRFVTGRRAETCAGPTECGRNN